MRSLHCVILLALAGVATAEDLKVFDLPPFTIALPDGEIKKQTPAGGAGVLVMSLGKDDVLKPLTGKSHTSKLLPPAARELQVQWDPSVLTSDDERKMVLNAITTALPIEGASVLREKVLPSGHRIYLLGSESVPIGLAFVDCGTNLGVTLTTAFTRDLDVLMDSVERMASSVVCKEASAMPPRPQVAYRLPKNFGGRHSEGIDTVMSSEGEMMIAGVTPQDIQKHPEILRALLSSIFSQALGVPAEDLTMKNLATPKDENSQTLLVRTKGELDGAQVNVRYCEAQDLSLFVMWYSVDPEIRRADERFGQVGCPGEPSEPLTELGEMFAAECKAYNEYACAMIKELGNF